MFPLSQLILLYWTDPAILLPFWQKKKKKKKKEKNIPLTLTFMLVETRLFRPKRVEWVSGYCSSNIILLQFPFSNDFSCVGQRFEDKPKRKNLTWQHAKISLKTSCPCKWCHRNIHTMRRNFCLLVSSIIGHAVFIVKDAKISRRYIKLGNKIMFWE